MTITRHVYEWFMALLAVAVLVMLPLEDEWARTANLVIWGLFTVDYVVRLTRSQDRRAFFRSNLVDLVAIMPLDVLRGGRVLRLVRLVRVARSASILWRVSADLRGVLRTNGLAWALAVTMALMLAGTMAITAVEPELGTFADGLWWTVVTTTTVGYGDISPSTHLGRGVAAALMVVGIGTIGMITGSIATYFVKKRDGGDLEPLLASVRDEVQRWHELSSEERLRVAAVLTALAEAGDAGRRAPADF